MKKANLIIGCFVAGLILSSCAGTKSSGHVQAEDISQSDSRFSSTKVLARENQWNNSGVIIKKGFKYEIKAEGKWLAGFSCKWTGPDGIGSNCALGDLGAFLGGPIISGWGPALVGKIGEDGIPFAVGSKHKLLPTSDGILYFRINDCKGCVWDNKGFLTVETTLVGVVETIDKKQKTVDAEDADDEDDEDVLVDIEQDVPFNTIKNNDAIAVVIGNSDYTKVKNVDYAVNDAQVMRKYLMRILGFKEGNIFFIANASKGDFELYFGNDKNYKGKLFNAVREGKSDVFIYYSGHGAPGLKDNNGYFVPVEADPQYIELGGYPLDVFYKNISKIPARSMTVVMDSCFSGSNIFENISPIVLEINNPVIDLKNGVVLSSSTGSQVSSWYNEKKHGMFTYFFLKAIHNRNADFNTDGNLTFDEIYKYISDNSDGVPYYARRIHGVEQNPTIEGNYEGKVLVRY